MSQPISAPRHPLDRLSEDEIVRFSSLTKELGLANDNSRYGYVMLREPHKSEVLSFKPGDALRREVTALIMDMQSKHLEHVCIELTSGELLERRVIDQAKEGTAPFLFEEAMEAAGLAMEDPDFLAALAAHGVTDLGRVRCVPLAGGNFGDPAEQGIRVARVVPYLAKSAEEFGTMASFWGHPIEGIVAHLDLTNRKVLKVIDTGPCPIPDEPGDIHSPGSLPAPRSGLKPFEIKQPEGVSFDLDGDVMHWQNWTFRIGYSCREGLTIHQVTFNDQGTARPILYRASLAEMVVNYSDPSPTRGWINYFDCGEYQFGRFANSLTLGCDCLGEITYKDIVVADDMGQPMRIPNGICIHEEDFGVLWKHTDPFDNTQSEVRRQRRLVVSCFLTAGNYDYGLFWYFYLDGKVEFEVKANGLVVTAGSNPENPHPCPVAPGVGGTIHQHLFCLRIDPMVDGVRNSVDEIDAVPVAMDRTNPIWGGAFLPKTKRLQTEGEAQRLTAPELGRKWKIVSAETKNRVGKSPSYVIHTESVPLLLSHPDSAVADRAKFATKSLWVTKYRRDEQWPAGYLVNMSPGGQGLPQYAARNESIVDEDIVVWHTFGLTHFPRTEDWPIMPCDYARVTLLPSGFFDRNPTLDVPPSPKAHCGSKSTCSHSG